MNDMDSRYLAGMTVVRHSFLEKLTDHILTFENLACAVRAGENARGSIDAIKGLAHRLYGVAGSVGFSGLGSRLRLVEHNIQIAQTMGHAPEQILMAIEPVLEDALDAMEALLD
jgi:HPt (histidine-containing phosphotransfer) domain-containing protein